MNTVILSFDSNENQSVFVRENSLTMKHIGAVESGSVKSARKTTDKLHKKERQKLVSELCLGRSKTMHMASMRESLDSDRFLVNTQDIQSHALLRRGFGTSVPFIEFVLSYSYLLVSSTSYILHFLCY